MSDQCPSQTEGLNVFVCNWPDGHAGQRHWDESERVLWEQPLEDPGVPPYRGDRAASLRGCVSDLHMAGIRTGADYDRLVGEIIASIYTPPQKPSVASAPFWPSGPDEVTGGPEHEPYNPLGN